MVGHIALLVCALHLPTKKGIAISGKNSRTWLCASTMFLLSVSMSRWKFLDKALYFDSRFRSTWEHTRARDQRAPNKIVGCSNIIVVATPFVHLFEMFCRWYRRLQQQERQKKLLEQVKQLLIIVNIPRHGLLGLVLGVLGEVTTPYQHDAELDGTIQTVQMFYGIVRIRSSGQGFRCCTARYSYDCAYGCLSYNMQNYP